MITFTRRTRLAAVVIAGLALSGCVLPQSTQNEQAEVGDGLPAAIAESGSIRIGTSPDFPPMEFKDPQTQETVGLDIDLMNALADQWGVELTIVEAPFDQLLNSVATGRVDIVMSGISDTVERQETANFVDYFQSQGRLYTTGDKAAEFTSATGVCGKTVAVSAKTDYYAQLANLSTEICESAGHPAIERLATDSGAAARLQIEQGRADLAVQGGENLAYLECQEPGKYKTVLDPLPGTPFGAVIKKDDMQLTNAVQQGFADLHASGEYDRILTEWGLEFGKRPPEINSVK